jgi:ribose transport system substrate-binding protein
VHCCSALGAVSRQRILLLCVFYAWTSGVAPLGVTLFVSFTTLKRPPSVARQAAIKVGTKRASLATLNSSVKQRREEKMRSKIGAAAIGIATVTAVAVVGNAVAQEKDGWKGAPRTFLWNSGPIQFTETAKYKKNPPWTIAVANASISNVWAVGWLHSLQYIAAQRKDVIKQLIVTDANDDANKQVADIQDLLQRKPDLLLVRPATAQALDPAVTRAMKSGVPVVLSDRSITSDNYLSLVNADDWSLGRNMAQWIAETLKGKGNIVMIAGIAGASPAENRIKAAHEVFDTYPDIKILDLQYTDWSPAKGKTVMAALIQKYGKQIDAVWSDHGLEGSGAIEAFVDAGYKDGEIPPITCADLNGCLTLAVKHKVPLMNFDYPPKMGGVSLEVALSVLRGVPVPKHYVISSEISISKGHETASVKADRWLEDYAQMNKSDDFIVSTGIPNYDPKTFKVE